MTSPHKDPLLHSASCGAASLTLTPALYSFVRIRVRVRVRVRVGAWMSQCREQSQVGRFTPRPRFVVVRVRVRVGGGMGHLKTENTQVVPPPAFYCINHNQARPLQSKE